MLTGTIVVSPMTWSVGTRVSGSLRKTFHRGSTDMSIVEKAPFSRPFFDGFAGKDFITPAVGRLRNLARTPIQLAAVWWDWEDLVS
jgi:hypothetical protein